MSLFTSEVKAKMQAHVRWGAAWLDAQHPGWWDRVHLGQLDLGHCFQCILGQLFSDFHMGLLYLPKAETPTRLSYDVRQAELELACRMGFTAIAEEYGSSPYADLTPMFEQLTELWKSEIQSRRHQKEQP